MKRAGAIFTALALGVLVGIAVLFVFDVRAAAAGLVAGALALFARIAMQVFK